MFLFNCLSLYETLFDHSDIKSCSCRVDSNIQCQSHQLSTSVHNFLYILQACSLSRHKIRYFMLLVTTYMTMVLLKKFSEDFPTIRCQLSPLCYSFALNEFSDFCTIIPSKFPVLLLGFQFWKWKCVTTYFRSIISGKNSCLHLCQIFHEAELFLGVVGDRCGQMKNWAFVRVETICPHHTRLQKSGSGSKLAYLE